MSSSFLQRGTVLEGKYRIERPIGKGGFTSVYQAVHTAMERPVAVKVFDPSEHDDFETTRGQKRAERFEREARLVSKLQHPNTITIHDFGIDDGMAFLVMEFVEGPTLRTLIREEAPLETDRVVKIFLQVLGSLEEAHHNDILHRDLKPANVMLATNFKNEEVVKVLDFGIARLLREQREDDQGRKLFMGTPRYAAPEQLTGDQLSLATDIYGVGALMWESLVGKPMVPTNDIHECASHAIDARPWRLPDDTDIPRDIATMIERAVRKTPTDRYDHAGDMIRALEDCATIEESALPEAAADESSLGRDGVVFDPNVTDPDGAADLLLEDDEPTDRTEAESPLDDLAADDDPDGDLPPPKMNDTDDSPSSALDKAPDELELDLPPETSPPDEVDDPAPAGPSSRPTVPDDKPGSPPSTPERSPDRSILSRLSRLPVVDRIDNVSTTGLVGAVAIVGIAGVVTVGLLANAYLVPDGDSTTDSEVATDSPSPADDADETDDEIFELAEDSPFTTDGILSALQTEGWRVDRTTDPIEMISYDYRNIRLSSGDHNVDLRLYQVDDESTVDDLVADITRPDRSVTFDHIVARIRPTDDSDRRVVGDLEDRLEQYRRAVRNQQRR